MPDTYYVEALIAPNTVNTLPPDTFRAYADHGEPAVRITSEAMAAATEVLLAYDALGQGSLAERLAFLEADGVEKFSASWHALLAGVEAKASALG